MRAWQAEHGPEREVIFRQAHPPGQQGMSDFFEAKDLQVTVAGAPLLHRLYHFTLVNSGWEHAEVVLGGESFTALASGLQNALWQLGGAPREHRTDSLSAAFANLDRDAGGDLRTRYEALCNDHGMEPTRNNRGVAHENGSIESRHGHLKARLEQALLLRGSRDFEDVPSSPGASLAGFVAQVVARHNARHRDRVEAERPHLQPLPARRSCDYDEARVRVTSSGGFVFRKVFYTVPSRLIGYELTLRAFDDRLELFLGSARSWRRCRVAGPPTGDAVRHAHVVRRPPRHSQPAHQAQAFANLIYRDALWVRGRRTAAAGTRSWRRCPLRRACRIMVDLMWLAHAQACEAALAVELDRILAAGELPDPAALQTRFAAAPDAGRPDTLPDAVCRPPAAL